MSNVHKQGGEVFVVLAYKVSILHVLAELYQVILTRFDVFATFDLLNNIENFIDLGIRVLVDVSQHVFHFTVSKRDFFTANFLALAALTSHGCAHAHELLLADGHISDFFIWQDQSMQLALEPAAQVVSALVSDRDLGLVGEQAHIGDFT